MDQQNSGWKNATTHNKEVLQLLVFTVFDGSFTFPDHKAKSMFCSCRRQT